MMARTRMYLTVGGSLAALLMSSTAWAQQQVVRFLHNETDPPSIEFFNNAIKAFEAENPGIHIEMEAVSTDGRLQKVLASINTKTMPEIFKVLPEERFEFARKGYLVPLDDMIDEIGRDDYVAGSLVPVEGKIYDVPYTLGNYGVLWQREDFLKAGNISTPKTWDELLASAETLTGGDGNFGFLFPAGKNRMTGIFLSQMIWSAGGTYFDKDLNVTFDNPGTVKALTFLRDIAKFSPRGIGSYSYGDMINVYLTGKIGLDIYAPRLIATAAANTPDLLKNTVAGNMPVGPSGVGVKFVNANSFALSSEAVGSKNVEAARKFLKFIVTGERLRDFSLTVHPHLIPPLKGVQEEVITQGAAQTLGGREEISRIAFDTSNALDFESEAGAQFKDGAVIRSGVVNPYIGSIVARDIPAQVVQRVVLQGEDPAAAAAWGQQRMQAIVDDLKKK
ncbi:sugar ABC transporter substrate-binding protein [Shinella sp. S4-D37]|uniref:ABC transporter substrate-binding protein n=1 Tax=Shinella sp. S4-D37 TaxID=3161999 RepID=UPI00346726AF